MSREEKPTVMNRRALFQTLTGRSANEPDPAAPAAPDPAYLAALEACRAGDDEGAAEALLRFCRANQAHLQARRILGRTLFRLGRHVQARVELENALRKAPDDPAVLAWHVLTLCRLGKTDKARESLDRLEALDRPGAREAVAALAIARAGIEPAEALRAAASLETLFPV